jgi:hypothetical protein
MGDGQTGRTATSWRVCVYLTTSKIPFLWNPQFRGIFAVTEAGWRVSSVIESPLIGCDDARKAEAGERKRNNVLSGVALWG